MKLQDRVAIVTGAAQGIGKAVADKLAAEGAKVVAVDVNGEGAERTAAGIDGTGLQADISSPEDVQRMVDETVSQHGKVDVLANVAAIVPFTAWDDITFDDWRRIMSVNLDGLFLTMKAVEKPMRDAGYGRIVNVTSNVILGGTPNLAHYVASYDDPPYATLMAAETRISLAEESHPAEDRPGVTMRAPNDPSEANVVLVLEVEDARAVHRELTAEGVRFLAEPYEPPWGGCRFFCVDPDGYLVEI